jgi:hypothetical protein
MKKNIKWQFIFCLLWTGLSLCGYAQGDYLYLHRTDGSAQSFNLAGVRKITFTDAGMVVNPLAGAALPFAFGAVSKLTFEDAGLGVARISQPSSCRIYYNPQTRSIEIESGAPIGAIAVYGIAGRVAATLRSASLQESIQVSHLPAGVYLVKAGSSISKIIKN